METQPNGGGGKRPSKWTIIIIFVVIVLFWIFWTMVGFVDDSPKQELMGETQQSQDKAPTPLNPTGEHDMERPSRVNPPPQRQEPAQQPLEEPFLPPAEKGKNNNN